MTWKMTDADRYVIFPTPTGPLAINLRQIVAVAAVPNPNLQASQPSRTLLYVRDGLRFELSATVEEAIEILKQEPV